jgi:parallel beta-helix repeat protein
MGGCVNSTVSGNVVQFQDQIGIELQSCDSVSCTGNTVIDCALSLTGEASAGIVVAEGFWGASFASKSNVVSGNTVRSAGAAGQYGISVASGVDQCIVTGNMLVGAGTIAGLNVSATAKALVFGNMLAAAEEDRFVLRGTTPKFVVQNAAGNADFWVVPEGAGQLRLDKSFASAAVPANFVAQVCIPIKDTAGSLYYIPAKFNATW